MKYQSAKVKTGKECSDYSESKSIVNIPLTYRFGLVYEPIKDFSLYASYSNYFRPNRKAYDSNTIYINKNGDEFFPKDGKEVFKPQSGYQAEIGFKYNVNQKIQLNASAYYIFKENIVEFLGKTKVAGVDKKISGQIGQVDSKGFEIDATIQPISGLNITGGYSYCEAKCKEFSSNKYSPKSKKGLFLARVPKSQFFMWSFYEVKTGFLKNLNIGFGVNYTDKMFTNYSASNNDYSLPSYWLTEATLGYKLNDNVYCKFKVNNIFNNEYFSNSVYDNQFIPGKERNFLFTIGYKL